MRKNLEEIWKRYGISKKISEENSAKIKEKPGNSFK